MNEFMEKFRNKSVKEWVGPSGIKYRLRPVSRASITAALGSIPAIAMSGEKTDPRGWDQLVQDNAAYQNKVVRDSIISVEYDGEVAAEIPDPVDLPGSDVSRIWNWLQDGTGLDGEEAADARRLLPI